MNKVPFPIVKEILSYLPERDKISARHAAPIFFRCDLNIVLEERLVNIIFTDPNFIVMKMDNCFFSGVSVNVVYLKPHNFRHKTLITLDTAEIARKFIFMNYELFHNKFPNLYFYQDDYLNYFIINRANIPFIYLDQIYTPGILLSHQELNLEARRDFNSTFSFWYKPCYIGKFTNQENLNEVRRLIIEKCSNPITWLQY